MAMVPSSAEVGNSFLALWMNAADLEAKNGLDLPVAGKKGSRPRFALESLCKGGIAMESDLYWWVVMDTGAEMLLSPETVILLCAILELVANLEIVVLTVEVSCIAAGEGEALLFGTFARVELYTVP